MKHLRLNIILTLATTALLAACSVKKEDAKNDEAEKIEMTESGVAEQAGTEIKVFNDVDASVKTQINGLLMNYFKVTKALIDDDAANAKAAAKVFRDNLSKFDMSKLPDEQMSFYHIQEAKLSMALKRIQESVDLDEIRRETSDISDSMYAMIKAYNANSGEVYYNYCPMARDNKGAYWLSEIKEIENPYMGQLMPHCGSTKEVLN
jgi:hypothetical protein